MSLNKLIIIIIFSLFCVFTFSSKEVFAQYCSGGGTCQVVTNFTVCTGTSITCSGNSDCGLGRRCTQVENVTDTVPGTCVLYNTSCGYVCPYSGGSGSPQNFSYGSCSYNPPPVYVPPVVKPYVPPVITPGTSPEPNPQPTATPDPLSYACNPCSGTCEASSWGTDIQACQASCYILPPGSPQCVDDGGGGGGDPRAGESSCPDVQEHATETVVQAGQSISWSTWAPPAGATAAQRLTNPSTGPHQVVYSSPGNMVTVVHMFQTQESEPHSFYLYDAADETFYFLETAGKPPVIFSRQQEVVDKAVELGYTLIEDPQNTPESLNAARAIEKRVYKLPGNQDNPWKDNGIKRPVAFHAPWGRSLGHIPYVNCASLFDASGHRRYFSTRLDNLLSGKDYCFQRQNIPLRFPKDDEDDETTELYMSGNYIGLEQDLAIARAGDPEWSHIFGQDNSGDLIWPRNGILEGPDWRYFDNFAFAFMETKESYLARPESQNTNFRPGFLRQAVLQIPIDLFQAEGNHFLHAFIGMGRVFESDTPAADENVSDACIVSEPIPEKIKTFQNKVDPVDPYCKDFQVVDEDGHLVKSGSKVKVGETYRIQTNAQGPSTILGFYNRTFSDPKITQSLIDNWDKTGSINIFEIITCSNLSAGCHENFVDNKALKVTQTSQADQTSSLVLSEYIDSYDNVTDHTFNVEFWARVDGNTAKTIPEIIVERQPYTLPDPSYQTVGDGTDSRKLRFSNFSTANDLNDTTESITVTNQWKLYSGIVTFDYNTENPTDHPNGSLSTKIRLKLKAPQDGTPIYYDDFAIISWKQPFPYFRMTSALEPAPGREYDQCDLSIRPQPGVGTFTNLAGDRFWTDMLIPEGTAPGRYNMFAAMQTAPNYTYYGNPNATVNCGNDPNEWNDSIASTCRLEVEVISCNDVIPPTPAVARVNNTATNLPNTTASSNPFNDINFPSSDSQVTILASAQGTADQIAAVTGMVMTITPYNTDEPVKEIYGTPGNPGDFWFVHEVGNGVTQENFTNEFTIDIRALNGNACNAGGELSSAPLVRNIRLLTPRLGYLVEVPRNEIENNSCNETRETLVSIGEVERIVDITTDSKFNSMSLSANTVGGSFGTIVRNAVPTLSYQGFGVFGRDSLRQQFSAHLPYNPTNIAAWRNQITSFDLTLPENTEEESYFCVEACNPNQGTDLQPVCRVAGTTIPNNEFPGGVSHLPYSNDLNVYVYKGSLGEPWWQTRGGLVYAAGKISSSLPYFNNVVRTVCQEAATDVCFPYINGMGVGLGGAWNSRNTSAGIVITNNAAADAIDPESWSTQHSAANPFVEGANIAASQENYDYFFGLVDQAKLTTISSADQTTLPATGTIYDSSDNLVVFYRNGNLNLNLAGSGGITIPAGQKRIVFVEGNLTIRDTANLANQIREISVGEGGFLGFFVRGDIIIEPTVGNTNVNMTAPVIQGVFYADKTITVQSTDATTPDKKFIGEGSFIGREGVTLTRSFETTVDPLDAENNSRSPGEQFIFSPSLVVNTPNLLRRADLKWQEIN